MPVHLGWRQARFGSFGGPLGRADLARRPADVPLVINCTGLGIRALVNDPAVRSARSEVGVEVEQRTPEPRIVHCYGRGGAGVTVSWECADEVFSLVQCLHGRTAALDAEGVDVAWSGS